MKTKLLPLLILMFSLISTAVSAFDASWAQYVERRVTSEVGAIVKGFDPTAIVMVRVGVASVKEVDLPGTPFNVGSATITGTDGSAMIGSVTVTILGDRAKITPEAQGLIQKVATVDNVKPQIQYQPLPKGFVNSNGGSPAETDANPANKDEKAQSIGEQVRDVIKMSAGALGSDIRQMLMIGALIIGMAVVGMILVLFNLSRQASKIAQTMASSEANRSANSEPVEIAKPKKTAFEIGGQGAGSAKSDGDAADAIQKLPFEAVHELLGDCYWGAHDGYARFIWNRMSVDLRKKIIESSKTLGSYVSSLGDMKDVDLGAHADPVYLKGLKLAHLDNATLAELVRKQPILFSILPRLRVESMGFGIVEWVELNNVEVDASEKMPDFASVPASKPRDVKVRHKFTKISREDEDSIVGLRDIDVSIVEGVRSVAWIVSIEGDPLKDILKDFTAQELAEALDTPQAAVDHVLNHLPDKKRQLTVEYMRKGISSRQTESFDALFSAILTYLRNVAIQAQGESDVSDESREGGDNVSAA